VTQDGLVDSSARSNAGLIRFLHRAGRLKHIPRTGWLDRGVPAGEAESVADHTFRVALLAWLAAGPGMDRDRVLKLALLHDLAEAVTGDVPPYDPDELVEVREEDRAAMLNRRHVRSKERAAAKRAAESTAMADLLADLPEVLAGELWALWRELEDGTSAEARFVKQADKLETYLQSLEYLADDPLRPMDSFAVEVADVIDVPVLVGLRDAVTKMKSNDDERGDLP
jgi:putative hydrolases of HD superfamily